MVWLKFEDEIWNIGPKYEYINSDLIRRIRITRKRIRFYFKDRIFGYIYVGKTRNNLEELKKINQNLGFWE